MPETIPETTSTPNGHRPVPRWFTALADWGLALLKPFLPARWLNPLKHGAWFIAVGVMNTIIAYSLFVLLLNFTGLSRVGALMGAYFIAYFISFQTFSRLVFTGGDYKAMLRFAPSQLLLYASNQALLEGLFRLSGWSEELCQFVLLPVVALLSYGLNRWLVFRGGTKN